MSAKLLHKVASTSEERLAASLVSVGRLSLNDVQRISDAMQTQRMGFAEAALHLGCITPKDIGWAEKNEHKTRDDGAGPIETLVRRVSTSRALVVREGVPVKPSQRLVLPHDPHNPHSEQVRALRTELLLRLPHSSKANVLAVISAGPREGRSQLAAELALTFAQLRRRTLLIDADFRSPKQHELFDCENGEGLSEAIATADQPMLHRVEDMEHMALLTAGCVPSNPLELLSDGRFAKCMLRWRDTYDYILIDTPPISRGSDALAVAAIAGKVVMLTRTKHTSYRDARQMLRRLVNTQAQVLGAVLNNF